MDRLQKFLRPIVIGAMAVNIGLLGFGHAFDLYDLQILSIVNMIFLSFVLLYEKKD